jgi:hypothetical protein
MTLLEEVQRLVGELDSLKTGEKAAASLVECGPVAIEPLRKFLMDGRPRKIFQPRFWAVGALARLGAREVLLEYLFQERDIPDPEDRFGEEAVESAAARYLAAWPDEEMYESLLKLSERRMLNGLIEALAHYRRPETIAYFERALEDDFYRSAAEEAFLELGKASSAALVLSAVTPRPSFLLESPSSIERRRSALRLLSEIGMDAGHWRTLRGLIRESDEELVVGASKLGVSIASTEDRLIMARRLVDFLSSAPWHLQEDIENVLVLLKDEAAEGIDGEIARRMDQPEEARASDERLRALLRVKRRFGQTWQVQ